MFRIRFILHRLRRDGRRRRKPARYLPVVHRLESRLVPSTFREFPVAPLGALRDDYSSGRAEITAGPDGNLWFTDPQQNLIGQITTDGSVTEFPVPSPFAFPTGITAGPDGNLWFAESAIDGGIGRITPDGQITEFPLLAPFRAADGITAGPDGNLWFTQFEYGPEGPFVGRITPDGQITDFPVPHDINDLSDSGITTGPDGNVWFEVSSGVRRITADGQLSDVIAPFADAITVGPDGNIWTAAGQVDLHTGRPAPGVIRRITPDGDVTEFMLPKTESGWMGITAGPDGNVWFTEPHAGNIGMITPDGAITEFHVAGLNPQPAGIATGPDGNIWFTELGSDRIGEYVLNDGSAAETAASAKSALLAQAVPSAADEAHGAAAQPDPLTPIRGSQPPAVATVDAAFAAHRTEAVVTPKPQPTGAEAGSVSSVQPAGGDLADGSGLADPLTGGLEKA
jgi:streptogramin lyase